MTRDGHAVGLLSGELQVEQRVAVLKRYREGKEKVLITTNVMARGKAGVQFLFCFSIANYEKKCLVVIELHVLEMVGRSGCIVFPFFFFFFPKTQCV